MQAAISFLCQVEQEAKGSEAAMEKGVRKAWERHKLSTFSWKGQDIVMTLSIIISTKDFAAPAGKCPVTGWLGKGESTHHHRAAAASCWSTQTLYDLCDAVKRRRS